MSSAKGKVFGVFEDTEKILVAKMTASDGQKETRLGELNYKIGALGTMLAEGVETLNAFTERLVGDVRNLDEGVNQTAKATKLSNTTSMISKLEESMCSLKQIINDALEAIRRLDDSGVV